MTIVFKNSDMRVNRMELGPYGTNTYIVVCQETGESLVVDAPGGAGEICKGLKGTQPRYLLLTHDHLDHTGALDVLRQQLQIPLATHLNNTFQLKRPPEILLNDGGRLSLGKLAVEVLHTPGHTPGSLCFKIGKILFAGDTIFPGGPGRTNSATDFRQILVSITEKIFKLPAETVLFPGHGPETNVERAKEEYAIFASRSHTADLCGDVLWQSS
jgi:glyoxylase-like metal-dependent hydrolase (beta-lactamase superfamily II)